VVIGEKDSPKAERLLLAFPGIKAFSNNLRSAKEHAAFRQHMTRYLKLYLPDCPFEISSTNRYTGTTFEATIISRRDICEGEEIKYLCGTRAILTLEEEEDLDERSKNFSIIITTRNQATSLLAGPGRFANHDCNANARLTTPGISGLQIFAVRNIGIGEEITVTYDQTVSGQ
jgi:histone-lysine N-methyltransferase SUV420H